jgi:hypothetical protein
MGRITVMGLWVVRSMLSWLLSLLLFLARATVSPAAAGDPCSSQNCGFHGACNATTAGICKCGNGYQGPRCLSSPGEDGCSYWLVS